MARQLSRGVRPSGRSQSILYNRLAVFEMVTENFEQSISILRLDFAWRHISNIFHTFLPVRILIVNFFIFSMFVSSFSHPATCITVLNARCKSWIAFSFSSLFRPIPSPHNFAYNSQISAFPVVWLVTWPNNVNNFGFSREPKIQNRPVTNMLRGHP